LNVYWWHDRYGGCHVEGSVCVSDEWLVRVAEGASRDAGGVPEELLGDYLMLLADAATHGRPPGSAQLDAVGRLGRRAAESGVPVGQGVDLYLSAARRVWNELPAVVRARDSAAVRAAAEAVLRVIDVAVAAFAEGHAQAGRELVRREESLRREFVADLLRGDADLGDLVQRAEPFGLALTRPHQVALAAPGENLSSVKTTASMLERVIVERFGDRDVLVATKEGLVVVVAPTDQPPAPTTGRESAVRDLGDLMYSALDRIQRGRPWRVVVGRTHPGAYGIARSYEEAREGLTMALRMRLDTPVVRAKDLLVYRVLLRDQPAIADLVRAVLAPLRQARGGAAPLLDTLDAYFASGAVTTVAARRLHLSVRAVTYRLDRVSRLTGYDPADPTQAFTLQVAAVGARLLDWPDREL